jgi:hypothetical protein
MDIAERADLLRETGERHGQFEKTHVAHSWADWYAAYLDARDDGRTPDEASEVARHYMEDELGVAPL